MREEEIFQSKRSCIHFPAVRFTHQDNALASICTGERGSLVCALCVRVYMYVHVYYTCVCVCMCVYVCNLRMEAVFNKKVV
jgi:hypothetical protein